MNYDEMRRIAEEEAGLDLKKMEAAADKIVAVGVEAGLTRKEMASVCAALAANHMVATGVERERAVASIGAMYDYRQEVGLNDKVLVDEPKL